MKLARWKVSKWGSPLVDVWSDEQFWRNERTGEIRWTAPRTEEYLPNKFKMPKELAGLTDQELDNLKVVTHGN